MNPKRFFAELKRRNVYRVAAADGVIAWLLIQAASILFPTFGAPGWVMKIFITTVALGFPVALTRRTGVGRLALQHVTHRSHICLDPLRNEPRFQRILESSHRRRTQTSRQRDP